MIELIKMTSHKQKRPKGLLLANDVVNDEEQFMG